VVSGFLDKGVAVAKKRLISLSVVFSALAVVGLFQPVPYVLERPGPLFNTLGAVDGTQLVSISGTKTYPTRGELNMTTVSVYGGPEQGIDLIQAIGGWFNPKVNVIPREVIYPENFTEQEQQQQSVADFSGSQSAATAAALNYLHLPVQSKIFISSIEVGMPADGVLEPGDVVLSVNGVEVTSARQAVSLIRVPPVGKIVHISVLRKGSVKNLKLKTVSHPEHPNWPFIGIGVDTKYQATFNINFGVNDVGGPSGGTMFALSIIDKLTPGALTDGNVIAGTGTITAEGEVGAIGGIAQKMIASADHGAKLFIAPKSNCEDIVGHVPAGLKVVPVETLTQAVKVLNDFTANKPLATCPVNAAK